ncbi:DUF6378 domain-containing protein [Natronoarchaeum rubrum]|uniref:DUF6378 domain-containing protein n=1 Tax=Natronoarchaeum rubrum TaxID=755311 RepID=UPI002111B1E1|nr:DUF6378 domain-containing protein [Natronoarchaeum rubrum]
MSDEPTNRKMPSGDEMAASLLLDTADLINDDRDTHGDAVENQQHIAAGWTWFLRGQGTLDDDERLTGTDVAFMMALLKMSRHSVGTFDVDHLRDTAGYAGIGAACAVARGEASLDELERGAYEDEHLPDDVGDGDE